MPAIEIPDPETRDPLDNVRTTDLAPYFRNPRVGNVPLIVDSLKAHGQYKPLVVNRGTLTGRPLEVLAGNHLLQAGLKLGLPTMWVFYVDVDDTEAAKIVLVDNRSSDRGGYDDALLAEVLTDIPDLLGTGYSDGDLSRLLNGLESGDEGGQTDSDDVPELPVAGETITAEGDVWLLGPHRLVCGDSRFVDTLTKLVDGATIDALWTDPPYGVDYVGKTADKMTIQNDGADGLADLLSDAFKAALHVLRNGAPCYVACPPGPQIVDFYRELGDAGYLLRQNLVWVKNAMVLGRSDYQYRHEAVLEAETPAPEPDVDDVDPVTHEPIVYGFTPGSKRGRLGRGGPAWFGNNKQTTVFEIAKPAASRDHRTMKPVELVTRTLRNSVARNGSVLDLFGGSGTTLIAAHQLHLRAFLVELSPRYCDVIARRYQEHTGVMPILERTGDGVSFVPDPR